jgi:hypothetical protein
VAEGQEGLSPGRPRAARRGALHHRLADLWPVQSAFTAAQVALLMKMRFLFLAWVLAVGAALAFVAPVARASEEQRPISVAAATVSMEQAVKMAEQRFKAKVVRAETQHNDGRTVYVLRLLNESGRVWTVRVDASNGALL